MRLTEAYRKEDIRNIRELYREAFPAIEQKPFDMILEKRDAGQVEILSAQDEEKNFMGLAITALHEDRVLLDYFAISPKQRGNGVGSAVIELLKERYTDKRVVLEIERTDVEADNIEQRIRRKGFYQKNGLSVMPYYVRVQGTEMEILTNNCRIDFEEYHEIYREVFGRSVSEAVTLL